MSTIPEIEDAVRRLSPDELAAFRLWLAEFDADAWDQQFEQDVTHGKLDKLAEPEKVSGRVIDETRDFAIQDIAVCLVSREL